ncbi:GDYXXLXY domain-containing protein [Pontibacter qinzhouensis]|uniref:GDYXXLXY domain-containing protein n=1 Tax=Pontibacter qinzhouensis TaxID=2603253 RepID=A0A5C8ITU0_9BACT|nr:GDYXXLXY domain-containing protein [Pontibacter qinzhouensis]TXK24677.1 GDYXXLXY domain-containing protein [Pontibacter qinzhouensis]
MKLKNFLLPVFILVCLAQLYIPVSMIRNKEDILQNGKEFKFLTAPIDPYDPFRGKYVSLDFKENNFPVNNAEAWKRGCSIYLHLKTDTQGFTTISGISPERPAATTDYIAGKVEYVSHHSGRNHVFFQLPFDRYYMEESKAYEAEVAYRTLQQDSTQLTYALVRVKEGEAVLQEVLVNEVPLKVVVEQQREL